MKGEVAQNASFMWLCQTSRQPPPLSSTELAGLEAAPPRFYVGSLRAWEDAFSGGNREGECKQWTTLVHNVPMPRDVCHAVARFLVDFAWCHASMGGETP